ncbi:AAA family ATPase [Vibrio sp. La 4.2.2]|uniref:AAA family ATPase n=1 Tax=Vibrio sp. La 4.2.2 TaxID=2998830 RepID=UPI0022CDC4A2|nr:AAA family ATPase [Vibrio sp. La 4.2.2]MDA0107808.1 AAA family ATPase [Vibrio sp. La 4.2.2]
MKSIRVRNLRSFSNDDSQPFINLKPITVFVGKNSCGKSSLLRTLPLLRQSIESRTSGPFLWYGNYVDYGSFSEAKNKNSHENTITFDYIFDIKLNQRPLHTVENKKIPIALELSVSENKRATIANKIKLTINKSNFEISFNKGSPALTVDGHEVLTDFTFYFGRHGVLPSISIDHFIESEEFSNKWFNEEEELDSLDNLKSEYEINNAISRNNVREIINIVKPKTDMIGDDFSLELFIVSNLDLTHKYLINSTLEKLFQPNEPFTKVEIDKIYHHLLIIFLPRLVDRVNYYLSQYAKSIKYIAPLRATAERFYRFQDLRVEELDHTGSNLAMLLRNMTSSEMIRFQRWCSSNFGFVVSVPETQSLHYEIVINIDGQENNISDMGFGFSQILPIITMLWFETRPRLAQTRTRRLEGIPLTFVIEQPELHLHPQLQATLAKVLASVAHKANSNLGIQIIFETHSKTMIDAIGDYIENNECSDLASIYIFEKEDNMTVVRESGFDEEGDLVNWPLGFFSGR